MLTADGNCLQDIFFLPEKHRNKTKNKSRMHILPSLSYMLHIQYAAFNFDSPLHPLPFGIAVRLLKHVVLTANVHNTVF